MQGRFRRDVYVAVPLARCSPPSWQRRQVLESTAASGNRFSDQLITFTYVFYG